MCLLFSFMAIPALAKGGGGGRYEVSAGTGTLMLSSGGGALEAALGFRYQILLPWTQVGADLIFNQSTQKETSITQMILMIGPTLNAGEDPLNSYFFTLGLALRTGSSSVTASDGSSTSSSDSSSSSSSETAVNPNAPQDPNGVGFGFLIGKRFNLINSLSFRPTIGVLNVGTIAVIFQPLQLSYQF